jgi:putative glycosyltransferase (TIGR04348 family)
MKIILITPAAKQSKSGNRTTTVRWARVLQEIGHRVSIQDEWDGRPADMMVAIHAWRSASSIERFHQLLPDSPLVVVLSGTDIYSFQHSHPEETLRSMAFADALVCLHDLVHKAIPSEFKHKLHVIHQSALPLKGQRSPSKRHFDVCVVGHLREVKDSLRCAYAARSASAESRLRVFHLGKAHDDDWARRAREEMEINTRYHWLGEVGAWRVRQELAKTQAMVLSSVMEGGANVISEAVIAGVPVIASKIDGNVGLLGEDYPGYFSAKDTDALHALLQKAETDKSFLRKLSELALLRKPLFVPERELHEWKVLLQSY